MTDRTAEALWVRIAEDIRADIESGKLRPGEPVDSEGVLMHAYAVSRGPVRQALLALEHQGLLEPARPPLPRRVASRELLVVHLSRAPGLTHPGESPTMGADAWMADMLAAGREPEQHPVVVSETASAVVAARLGLEPGDRVVSRRLVRYAGGQPHNLITFWFTDAIARGTILARQASITEGSVAWLERNRGPVEHDPWELVSRPPGPCEISELRIPPAGVAVAEVSRTARNPAGTVMFSVAVYRGDRTRLRP